MNKLIGTWVCRHLPGNTVVVGEIVHVYNSEWTPLFLVRVDDRYLVWQANAAYITTHPNPAELKGYRE